MTPMSYDLTLLDLPAELAELRAIAHRDPIGDALERCQGATELFSLHLNNVATGICCEQWVRFEMLVAGVDESFAQRPRWDQ